jgi:hypothetical protein
LDADRKPEGIPKVSSPRQAPPRIGGIPLHPSLTPERIAEAAERQIFGTDNPGFCVARGAEAEGCEPDAQAYPCDSCGRRAVYGAEELVFRIVP